MGGSSVCLTACFLVVVFFLWIISLDIDAEGVSGRCIPEFRWGNGWHWGLRHRQMSSLTVKQGLLAPAGLWAEKNAIHNLSVSLGSCYQVQIGAFNECLCSVLGWYRRRSGMLDSCLCPSSQSSLGRLPAPHQVILLWHSSNDSTLTHKRFET